MGPLARGLSEIIGFGTEAYAHQKQKRAISPQPPPYSSNSQLQPPENDLDHHSGSDYESEEEEDNEDDWIRDDTQAQLEPDITKTNEKDETIEEITAKFTARHRLPDTWQSPPDGLPLPVILPQRRPGSKFRGFVHGYAPPLQDCGIDQAAWFDFLDGFEKAINEQGWFHTINAAVALGDFAYHLATFSFNPILKAVTLTVHISIETSRRLYMSKKTNSFLDTMNTEFFQPRGLYALVMQYKPSSSAGNEIIDANSNTNFAIDKRVGGDKSKFQDYRSSSGKTVEQQIPECCPLVWPQLEKASDEQKKNAVKRAGLFFREYQDSRSEAKFEGKNPDSKLKISDPAHKKEFASMYSDPNSKVNQGGLIGMITGGVLDPKSRRVARRNNIRGKMGRQPKKANKQRGVKRLLTENVLYLMVVNMPSAEEMAAAKEYMARIEKESPGFLEKAMSTVKNT